MTQQVDVLVIGGGVVGICAAHFLQEQGREVTVVEKDEVCAGSSYGNAGLIVPSHSVPLAEPGVIAQGLRWMFNPDSPFYIKWRWDRDLVAWLWQFRKASTMRRVRQAMPLLRDMHLESFRLYEALAAELDFAFGHEGRLLLCKTEQGLESVREEAELMQEVGIEVEMLDEAGVQQRAATVELDCMGGAFYAQDAHLDPARLVRALAARCVERGVQLNEKTEVLGFGKKGRRVQVVETTRGDFAAAEVVLCSGAWSPGVARGLGLSLPVQPAKGYSVTVHKPSSCPAVPLMFGGGSRRHHPDGGQAALCRYARIGGHGYVDQPSAGRRDCQCGAALRTGVDAGCVRANRSVAGPAALYAGRLALFRAGTGVRQSHGGGRARHGWGLAGGGDRGGDRARGAGRGAGF